MKRGNIFVLIITLSLLLGCKTVITPYPTPRSGESLTAFPRFLQGIYTSADGDDQTTPSLGTERYEIRLISPYHLIMEGYIWFSQEDVDTTDGFQLAGDYLIYLNDSIKSYITGLLDTPDSLLTGKEGDILDSLQQNMGTESISWYRKVSRNNGGYAYDHTLYYELNLEENKFYTYESDDFDVFDVEFRSLDDYYVLNMREGPQAWRPIFISEEDDGLLMIREISYDYLNEQFEEAEKDMSIVHYDNDEIMIDASTEVLLTYLQKEAFLDDFLTLKRITAKEQGIRNYQLFVFIGLTALVIIIIWSRSRRKS